MAAVEHGQGRVVFLTDINAFNSYSAFDLIAAEPGSANGVVWENIFDWAAGGGE